MDRKLGQESISPLARGFPVLGGKGRSFSAPANEQVAAARNKRLSAWLTPALFLAGCAVLLFVVARELWGQDTERVNCVTDKFIQACNDNKLDPGVRQQILDACLKTPKPLAMNPCEQWAEAVDAKLPPRTAQGFVRSTARLNRWGTAISGVHVGQVAWGFRPCAANLWCVLASGHFAICVTFPDGQKFYFDDGDWGRIFQSGDIPDYAR
jgi:hypothetical protein